MSTLARKLEIPHREICPPDFKRWNQSQGGLADLEAKYAEWLSEIASAEDLFKEHVYQTDDLTDGDARQHRFHLCSLMATGERLALKFLMHGDENDNMEFVQKYASLIDGKLETFRQTLHKWHGPIDQQTDLPDSLKQAASEIETGQIEDWEEM